MTRTIECGLQIPMSMKYVATVIDIALLLVAKPVSLQAFLAPSHVYFTTVAACQEAEVCQHALFNCLLSSEFAASTLLATVHVSPHIEVSCIGCRLVCTMLFRPFHHTAVLALRLVQVQFCMLLHLCVHSY